MNDIPVEYLKTARSRKGNLSRNFIDFADTVQTKGDLVNDPSEDYFERRNKSFGVLIYPIMIQVYNRPKH